MCQEVFHLVQKMNLKDIENQLALQCSPVIARVKISNLLMLDSELEEALRFALEHTGISYYKLLTTKGKTAFLIFRRNEYERYLARKEVQLLLQKFGYCNFNLVNVLKRFQQRYSLYMELNQGTFPHEIGILLGYSLEDVIGFVEHNGKDYLFSGYWKVYEDVEKKKLIFKTYEVAKDEVIQLLHGQYNMQQIIRLYSEIGNKLAI